MPSLVSCSNVTNLMARSPKLFSWRLDPFGTACERLELLDSAIVSYYTTRPVLKTHTALKLHSEETLISLGYTQLPI